MKSLNEETLDMILSSKFDKNFWLFELGRSAAIIQEDVEIERQFMKSFLDKGEKLWESLKTKLKEVLCDVPNKKINKNFEKFVLGNERELAVGVFAAISELHSIEAGIAIPLVALIIQNNLHSFCAEENNIK